MKYWRDIPANANVVSKTATGDMLPNQYAPNNWWEIDGETIYWHGNEATEAQMHLSKIAIKEKLDKAMSARDIFGVCRIQDNKVFLPEIKLDNFAQFKSIIVSLGGKWSSKEQCFVFKEDNPKTRIDNYLQNGKKTNTKKEQQAFFTPDEVADRAIELSNIEDGMTILEPCAGEGALVKAIRRKMGSSVVIFCFEAHKPYADKLPESNPNHYEVADFLAQNAPDSKYDRVIMNPPFGKGMAKKFVQKAFEWLKPHGLLIAILPSGKGVDLLGKAGFVTNDFAGDIYAESLPPKAFSESGTNIDTEIVIGRKPEGC